MALELIVLIGILLICILLKFPVFLSLALSAIGYALAFPDKMPIEILAQGLVQGISNYSLAGIVFFFFMGELMGTGGMCRRLITFCKAAIGHIRGGLSLVNILCSMLFGGVSGSALADTASIGSIIIPAMKEDGYSAEYSTAVTIASSCVGPIIPPSTGLIMLGIYTSTNILRLLMGGLLPGILMGAFMMCAAYLIARKRNYAREEWRGWRFLLGQMKENFLAVTLPLLVVVCLSAGIGTVNEVGAVTCFYAVFLSCVVYKDLTFKDLIKATVSTAKTAGKLLCIIGSAGMFTWIIGSMGLRNVLMAALAPLAGNPVLLLFLCVLIMLAAGMFLDHTVILLVIVPLMAPSVAAAGIDMIQFCVLSMIVSTLGLITPPVGMLIYIGASIGEADTIKVVRELVPFLAALVVLIVFLVLCPGLTTMVPNLIYG